MPTALKPHNLFLFARHDLVSAALGPDDAGLLLEGSWPAGTPPRLRWSLDDAVDARFSWIDEEASRLTDLLAEPLLAEPGPSDCAEPALSASIPLAWLNALALRYYLVKLIRLVAYFTEVHPLQAHHRLRLVAAAGHDEHYADLVAEISRLTGASCRVSWLDRPRRPAQAFPRNARWRRAADRMHQWLEPGPGEASSQCRVVLCGNPRLLDPIVPELLRRRCRLWWLYDRFAVRSWVRWRAAGVGQLVCNSSQGSANRLVQHVPQRLPCRGVNLAGPVGRWFADRLQTHGPRQTRLLEAIDAHFRRVQPHAVILDEDATPIARAAVGLARQHGTASLVVQHGAPCCRFAFAPLAADQILVWGQSSQTQLIRWGVRRGQIYRVGSPRHDALARTFEHRRPRRPDWHRFPAASGRPVRILLLATIPPRDDRPDAVIFHATRRTYGEMLRMAASVVAQIPRAQLAVKPHPRAADDPIAKAVLAEFPSLESRIVRRGPLEKWLAWGDCVLSCASSAGIDATLARVPVIQLLPAGSGDVLPHAEWGTLGTARTESQLQPLLFRALAADRRAAAAANPNAFTNLDGRAAARIAEVVVAASKLARQGGPAAECRRRCRSGTRPESALPARRAQSISLQG